MAETLHFRAHLPNLLREAIEGHTSPGPLVRAVNLTMPLLANVARRAAELDDPTLNIAMLELALYDVPPEDIVGAINAQRARLTE